jgi:hypothetical protein
MSYTKTSETEIVAKDANSTIVDKMTNAITIPFGSSDTLHTSGEVASAVIVWSAVASVLGGMFTRTRVEEAPVLGFLF